MEEGTIIAKDESDAKEKLKSLQYKEIQLRKLKGFNALIRQFSADVK